jgi:starch-binding outer membrane protein, SusD/RagB family
MKKIVSIFSIAILLIISACNDDLLDKLPETAIGAENFFKSEEDLKMYIYNLYSFPGVVIYTNDGYNTTDNASNTAISEMKSIMLHSNPTSETFGSGWSWGALRRANFFLQYFRNNSLPEDVLVHYEGLARFFRARFYMEMVKRYSDVPWYDQLIGTSDEELLYKGRDPRAMVVEKIFEDYDFASTNVRAVQPVGAINKWAVLAFMSRDALYEGTYRKYHPELQLTNTAGTYLTMAATAAKEIMDNGGFNIYSTGNIDNDYGNLFNSTNLVGNPEVIFVNISEDGVKNSGWSNYWHDYEVSPARDLVSAYLMKDGTFFSSQPGFETKMFVDEFTNRDPRLKQTVNYPGWVYARTANPYVFPGSLSRYFTGYHLLKGFQNHTDQVRSNSIDVPLFRYAETLLIYAEAKAEMGQLSQADLDLTVNRLRRRAGMPDMAMNPSVDPVKEAKYANVKSSAQWREILEIRRERRVELAMEGYRFDDLMRWGAGKVLEKPPVGLYIPGPGNYDTTGDGIPDIKILPLSATIPAAVANREKNELGVTLLYYRIGPPDSAAEVFVTDGDKGYIIGERTRGTFVEPKYYYRPVPRTQTVLNPNLKQIFGWE